MKRLIPISMFFGLMLSFGCGSSSVDAEEAPQENTEENSEENTEEPTGELPGDLPAQEWAERPMWSPEQCTESGGEVIGDIGDGRIHRPEYRCADGREPTAQVSSGTEGAVCCAN